MAKRRELSGCVHCGCPARRVSRGKKYCREHFKDVIDEAKTEVVASAVHEYDLPIDDDPEGHSWSMARQQLRNNIDRLKELGWTPGD